MKGILLALSLVLGLTLVVAESTPATKQLAAIQYDHGVGG